MIYRWLHFFVIVSIAHCLGYSQITPGVRTELTYDRDFFINGVYNCHENGLVVSTSTNPKRAERDPDRLYILFDTNLIETMSLEIEVPFRQKISNTFTDYTQLYTLYYDLRFGDYTIIGIDPSKSEANRFTGKLPSKIVEQGFAIYNGFGVICNISKRKSEVYIVDLKTGRYQTIELPSKIKRSEIEILDIRPYRNGQELGLVYREHNRTKSNAYLIVFDEDGQKSQVASIGKDDNFVIAATSNRLDDGLLVVSGTYSNFSMISASGMFVSAFSEEGQVYFSTRAFSSLENFFDYMSDQRQSQMRRKIERSNERGRDIDVNVLMLIHPTVGVGNRLIVMGEVYFPTYRTVSTTTYINGRPVNNSTQVFDGYQYSHAAMLTFQRDGKFVEDNCFPISLWQKPYTLKRIVQVQTTDSTTKLAYMNSNMIRSKVFFNTGKSVEHTFNLQAGDNDKIRFTSGEIDAWFGSYFLSSGYQNIKSTDDHHKKKRDVFYLQKVEIR